MPKIKYIIFLLEKELEQQIHCSENKEKRNNNRGGDHDSN
jgi:hypothetical protein